MFGESGLSGAGASFQPGSVPAQEEYERPRAIAGSPVQTAIRILSLRLPRVIGAPGAIAPAPLLQSPGSGGDPRIDSLLERAWRRVMPNGPSLSQAPTVPVLPAGGDDRVGRMPTDIPPARYDAPLPSPWRRQRPSIDDAPLPRAPVPRVVPGEEQDGPRRPITDTPLPPPRVPDSDAGDFDPFEGYPNRFSI